jgi:hypothetical protein
MVPDRHGQEFEQLFRFHRVCDVLESAPLGQVEGPRNRTRRLIDDDGNFAALLVDLPQHLRPGATRDRQMNEHGLDGARLQQIEGVREAGRKQNLELFRVVLDVDVLRSSGPSVDPKYSVHTNRVAPRISDSSNLALWLLDRNFKQKT